MDARQTSGIRPGKLLRYRLDAWLLFGFSGLFRLFDLDRASALGAWLGRNIVGRIVQRPSTAATVRIAFPELDDAAVKALLVGMGENIGRIIAETALLEQFGGEAGRSRFTIDGLENLEAAQALNRGMMIVSGHFGNWEAISPVLYRLGLRGAGVARPPNNPFVAEWIAKKRASVGFQHQISKGASGTREIFSVLRRGDTVAMLVDQHLAEGIPAPLFGRDAMTVHAPATFAQKLGTPIVPMAVRRTDGAHFHIVFFPAITSPKSGNAGQDILAMTTAVNAFVEAEIRRQPAHWPWMHRRWKPVTTLSRRAQTLLHDVAGPATPAP